MDSFDVSLNWVILSPFPVKDAVGDLARCVAALRKRDGLGEKAPDLMDAAGPAPGDSVPVILLNMENPDSGRGGYTWRAGRDRVEIYGDSRRGLCNGIYGFLASLGFRWAGPGQESLPPGAGKPGIYPLEIPGAHVPSRPSPENRRRLVIPPQTPAGEIPGLCRWAARNQVDALILSLAFKDRKLGGALEQADRWALIVERGGWDLSFLAPRRYFFLNRDLFRMEEGRRTGKHHFCPTNPETIGLLRRRLAALLDRQAGARDTASPAEARRVYHFWPDRGAEHTWCACPACRAFNPREQIRLAVNALATVIAEKDPWALVSCRGEEEAPADYLPGGSEVALGPNIFALKTGAPPARGGNAMAEDSTVYLYAEGALSTL